MTNQKASMAAALQGNLKAATRIHGRGEPKIGVEEFMSLAERFGFTAATLDKIRAVVAEEDWGEGPFLANYYSPLPETKVRAYERVAREVFGVKYALGVSSGTAALHCAMIAAGVGPGTEVICPAIGFCATPAAVVLCNGIPIFCDVDASLHLDPAKLEALITPRTVAVVPTHVMGSIADLGPIIDIARRHNLKVIEDCAQSCGGQYRGQWVGTVGDMGTFSISSYKIVGGGEGGLFITNDEHLWERANQVAECGGLWRPDRFAPARYDGELFCGTNYRMSELEAAVDVVQLAKTPATAKRFHDVKLNILQRIHTFRGIEPQKLNDPSGEVGYVLRFYPQDKPLGLKLVAALKAEGLEASTRAPDAGPDWHLAPDMFIVTDQRGPTAVNCPFTCPVYRQRGGVVSYKRGDWPVAEDLFDRMVSVPLNQWYTPEDCQVVADTLNMVFARHCTPDSAAPRWLP
jgi:8-amino-3,8-dideoxy-alpha-D-manno-octulosonate transaminase